MSQNIISTILTILQYSTFFMAPSYNTDPPQPTKPLKPNQ